MEYTLLKMNTFLFYAKRVGISLLFFISNLFVRRKYDVIFYYPAHFNRGEDGSNPFLQPFFEACHSNGLSYIVLEEPVLFKCSKGTLSNIPFDGIFITILLLRKIIPLSLFQSFSQRERFIAKLLKPLFFLRFSFNNYVVLSNSMLAFFRGLEKDANLYDYQHGIIHSLHPGYLQPNGETVRHIKDNDANILLYGKGFQNVLLSNNTDGYYREHSFVVGYYDTSKEIREIPKVKKKILFSLQLINGKDPSDQKQYAFLLNFFKKNEAFFNEKDILILLKNHPRYLGNIDMTELVGLGCIEFCDSSIEECLHQSFLHMTFFSTCTFDAAQKSIPTILLESEFFPTEQVYGRDYRYPLGITTAAAVVKQIEKYMDDDSAYASDCKKVFDWYKNFYADFDKKKLKDLFERDIS